MIIDNQQKIYYNLAFMKLRKWQQKVIDEFPDIIKNYRKFISSGFGYIYNIKQG